jgi:transposase
MSNAKPRLSPWSRLLLVERVLSGRPAAHVAAEMGVSRATAYKWLRRFRDEGAAGLLDRSSRPRTSPHRTDPATEAAIVALRRDRRL